MAKLTYNEFAKDLEYPLRLKWTMHGWAVMGPIADVKLDEHKVVKLGEPFRFNGEQFVYGYIQPGLIQPRTYKGFN